ncbi:MAG: hypothetical protein MI810_00860 [Flavobacteriales bacterium]|nr:hypothetical protein [Flavobacteriales bacterium]
MFRKGLLFKLVLVFLLLLISYLLWWDYQEIHSGYYWRLYGLILIDKIALGAFIGLGIISIISLVKIWKNKCYIFPIATIALFTLYWLNVLEFGTPCMQLKGCHESICSDIIIKDNGEFRMSVSTQSTTHHYSGAYQVKNKTILLYQNPSFKSSYPESELSEIKKQEYAEVKPVDFNFWGSIFRIQK